MKSGHLRAFALVAWSVLLAGDALAVGGPVFTREPVIDLNDNRRAPLVAFVRYASSAPSTALVRIEGAGETRELVFGPEADPVAGLPILGLPAGYRYELQVTLRDEKGAIGATSRKQIGRAHV